MRIKLIKDESRKLLSFLPEKLITTSVFWWLLPISIVLPIFFGQFNISNPKEISLWLLIGTLAHFAMFPFVIYGKNEKSKSDQIILIFMMGVVRGSLISLLPPIFGFGDQISLLSRVTNSAVAVFYWNIIGSVVVEYGASFREKIKEVLNEILEKQIVGVPSIAKASSNDLTKVIGYLQEKIVKTVGASPTKEQLVAASNEIDSLIAEHIKPLSKSRWRDGQLTWFRAGFFHVVRSSLETTKIPVLAVVLFALPFALVTQTGRIGIAGTLIVQSIWILITLSLKKFIYRNFTDGNCLKQNLTFLIAVIFISYPVTFIIQSNLSISI